MISAARFSLPGGIPKRGRPRAHRRPRAVKFLIGALGGVLVGFLSIAVIIVAAGRLIAVSIGNRSEVRTLLALAPASDPVDWSRLSTDGMAGAWTAFASFSAPAIAPSAPAMPAIVTAEIDAADIEPSSHKGDRLARPSQDLTADSEASAPDTTAVPVALADASELQNDPPFDPVVTGSIPADLPRAAPSSVAAEPALAKTAVIEIAPPPPLPRVRPRLASLSPPGDAMSRPDEDGVSARTAIYDITAQTVYLPSGERLEAHSGIGELMDDPRHVQRKNRGATPPNVYQLKLRESLFHGVQAIRLTPVKESNMFGRDGILAHSYMLGPSGQSNGCVSFRDYAKFLRAYQRGEIDRMVVVSRLPKPPQFATRPKVRSAANVF
jgi:hypothetical protein